MRFDAARLEEYLKTHVSDFAGPLTVHQFKGGQSNPTYLLETPQRGKYVLRRKPPGKLLPSAHAVDREFRVISALHAQGFPVARPYVLCEDADVIGTSFYVMAHVEGRVIWEPDMPGATPAERAATYDAMNATLARLHSFDPAAIGLGDFGRGENYVARQVERWSKQYRASETERIDEMEQPDRLAAAASAAARADTTGARRLPARQCHPRSSTRRASLPCSTGNCQRSAIRWRIFPIT